MTTTITEPTTHTLEVPGATLTYDIRRNEQSTEPILMLIGSPMGAGGFVTLAKHFPDRTILTHDPRGTERSVVADPAGSVNPEIHADDLHRLIDAIGGGPVDLFATSGGAVNALALVAKHSEQVRTVVAHEPPLPAFLPDRTHAVAATRAIHETFMRSGASAAMAHFIAVVSHRGPFTAEVASQPAPDPALFGMPAGDDGSRIDPMFSYTIPGIIAFEPNIEALRAAPSRIVMAAGVGSEGEMANRGSYAVAELLGSEVTVFPGDHAGFLGGEYGQTGEPEAFATKLREVLASPS